MKKNVLFFAVVAGLVFTVNSCRTLDFNARGTYQLPVNYDEPTAYRTGKIDPFVHEIVESGEFGGYARRDPQEYINLVAFHIKTNSKNDFERVKRAHDFVIDYLDFDLKAFRSHNKKKQDAKTVVIGGRAIGQGYSNLFKAICDAMDIPNESIQGYVRGVQFNPFDKQEYKKHGINHQWNTVQINDSWYLVDVAWDAGGVSKYKQGLSEKLTWYDSYSTEYLFVNPQYFVYTHLPANLNYELLEYIVRPEDFIHLPYQRPAYFETVAQLSPHLIKEFEVHNDVLSLSYVLKDKYELEFVVFDKTGRKDLSNTQKYYEKKQTKRNSTQYYFNKVSLFRKTRYYTLRIYSRESYYAGKEYLAECGLIVR